MRSELAMVYGSAVGMGGLGLVIFNALKALELTGGRIHALGPPGGWRERLSKDIIWHDFEDPTAPWKRRFTWRRWRQGAQVLEHDSCLGRWAAHLIGSIRPRGLYTFTQVGLESLTWANAEGIPAVLESPNGHIRQFRDVYEKECHVWGLGAYWGHPSPEMVLRVETEYALAPAIRVYHDWAAQSMLSHGLQDKQIKVLTSPVDLNGYRPPKEKPRSEGPLRACFVGTLDLRKGFVYLLRAIRATGADRVRLEIVGATGDRGCRKLFERERRGLQVTAGPGDPVPAYHQAEVVVVPSLEDAQPWVILEAMACGLPVIATDQCGSAEWIRDGVTGWIVPAADEEALAGCLEEALRRRAELPEMGRRSREEIERLGGPLATQRVADWVSGMASEEASSRS